MDLAIRSVDVGAYAIDTDQPEADGTLAWDSTTVIVVSVAAGDRNGLGWTYGPAACADIVRRQLADVVCGRDPK